MPSPTQCTGAHHVICRGALIPGWQAVIRWRVHRTHVQGNGHGRAVQVDPIKPTLKAPGTKLLKLECDESLSNFDFNVNLRRYTTVYFGQLLEAGGTWAGAYTRPLFSST